MTPSFEKISIRSWAWMPIVAVILGVWEFAGRNPTVRLLISDPSEIVQYLRLHWGDVSHSAMFTAAESTSGMLAAVIFSVVFGLCAVYVPRLANLTYPWLLASQVIPFVCLAPLIILVFGPGMKGKIVLSALMSFFPIVTNILTGMREVPGPPLEMMRMMRARKHVVVRHVFVPYSLPYFFAGLRVAAPFAVIGAIVAEFNGAEWGIGKDIFIAAKRLEPELMMLGIFSGAALSGLLYSIAVAAEYGLGDWYQKGTSK
jgi:NitT/TauT family transport system permease protein